jgi:hypothetical protein
MFAFIPELSVSRPTVQTSWEAMDRCTAIRKKGDRIACSEGARDAHLMREQARYSDNTWYHRGKMIAHEMTAPSQAPYQLVLYAPQPRCTS